MLPSISESLVDDRHCLAMTERTHQAHMPKRRFHNEDSLEMSRALKRSSESTTNADKEAEGSESHRLLHEFSGGVILISLERREHMSAMPVNDCAPAIISRSTNAKPEAFEDVVSMCGGMR